METAILWVKMFFDFSAFDFYFLFSLSFSAFAFFDFSSHPISIFLANFPLN